MKEQKNALEFFVFLSGISALAAILSAGTATAGPRFDPHQAAGGLPACMENLSTCTTALDECETNVTSSSDQTGTNLPDSRFTVNFNTYDEEDGTVTDNLTGLVWMKNAKLSEPVDWDTALDVCYNLQDDGMNLTDGSLPGDWRLPDIKELQGLIDYGQYNLAIPPDHPFVDVQPLNYWSSTTWAILDTFAWAESFYLGYNNALSKSNEAYVWCVRDGQY